MKSLKTHNGLKLLENCILASSKKVGFMTYLLAFLILGITLGVLFKNVSKLIKGVDKLTQATVYLLLFFLGVQVGKNPKIMNNILSLGGQSLLLSIGAVFGSLLCSWIVYRFLLSKKNI